MKRKTSKSKDTYVLVNRDGRSDVGDGCQDFSTSRCQCLLLPTNFLYLEYLGTYLDSTSQLGTTSVSVGSGFRVLDRRTQALGHSAISQGARIGFSSL